LNVGDSDHSAAVELQIPVAEAPPFSPLTEESVAEARRLMEQAEVIVLTDVPFGPGNLANLKTLVETHPNGKPILLIRHSEGREWDFTGGNAAALKDRLHGPLVETVDNSAEALAALLAHSPGTHSNNTKTSLSDPH
jgi:iron complex transport system ATP-binding protein